MNVEITKVLRYNKCMKNLNNILQKISEYAEKVIGEEILRRDYLAFEFARKNHIPVHKVGIKVIPPYKEFTPNKVLDTTYNYTPPTYEFYVLSDV